MPDLLPYEALTRQPPTAPEAEAATLGALLMAPDELPRVRGVLASHEAFYDARHRHIYEAMLDLSEQGEAVDLRTVDHWLTERGRSGRGSYLSGLPRYVAAAGNAEVYARLVFEAALKREMIRRLTSVLAHAYEPTTDAFDVLDEAREAAAEAARGLPGRALTPSSQAVPDAVDALVDEARNGRPPGIPTGLHAMDAMIGGLRPGNLVCLAARPSMGKSALALTIARLVAGRGHRVAYFSMEMETAENIERLVAAEADINGFNLRARRLMDDDYPHIETAKRRLASLPIEWDDTAAMTPEDIRAKLHRITADGPVPVVVVDYLQLMRGRGDNRTQEVGYCSRALKALAKEYQCAVVMLSQLNRAVDKRAGNHRPMLADLRDSGEIEQDCDIVAFLYRPERYGITHDERQTLGGLESFDVRGLCEVLVEKQRGGPVGSAWLGFDETRIRFHDVQRGDGQAGVAPQPVEASPF